MKNFIGRFAPAILFVFLIIFAFAATGFAQDLDDVTISGRIVDSNNAPIVGATVTATLVTTNVERTVTPMTTDVIASSNSNPDFIKFAFRKRASA